MSPPFCHSPALFSFPYPFVIPSGARNLSFFSRPQTQERFLAPLGMTKCVTSPSTASANHVFQRFGKNFKLLHFIIGKRNFARAPCHGLQLLRVAQHPANRFRN